MVSFLPAPRASHSLTVHADVSRVCFVHCSRKLASLFSFFVFFHFGFVYCSIVLAFVPHLEYLFVFILGLAIVVCVLFFFFFFFFLIAVR